MPTAAEKFDAAFINARKRGAKTFTHNGKQYSTETAEGKAREQLKAGEFDDKPSTRNRRNYAKAVMERQGTPAGSTYSRGANLRADAYKQLVDEGKMDASGTALKKGGKVKKDRRDGIALRGKTRA